MSCRLVMMILCAVAALAMDSRIAFANDDHGSETSAVTPPGDEDWAEDKVKRGFFPPGAKATDPKAVIFENNGKKRRVVINATVSQPQAGIEYFLVKPGSKDHETLLVSDADPFFIGLATTAAGGTEKSRVRVWLEYDLKGTKKKVLAQDWLKDKKSEVGKTFTWEYSGPKNWGYSKKGDMSDFSYAKSETHTEPTYAPRAMGEVISLVTSRSALLNMTVASSSNNEDLRFTPNSDLIPPRGTAVRVIFEPQ